MGEKFTLFYGGEFSQWYRCKFKVEGIEYNCAEQYMMAQKALIFKDYEAHAAIMKSKDPREQKAIGREVRGFDIPEWNKHAKLIVYRANLAKFLQNKNIFDVLMSTLGTTLVEASPTDVIWGIGMSEANPDCHDRSKWKGLNWLGEVITKVRDDMHQTIEMLPSMMAQAGRS